MVPTREGAGWILFRKPQITERKLGTPLSLNGGSLSEVWFVLGQVIYCPHCLFVCLFIVNLTQAGVIWEKKPQLRKCPHQVDLYVGEPVGHILD